MSFLHPLVKSPAFWIVLLTCGVYANTLPNGLTFDDHAIVEENREPLAIFADQGLAQMGPAVSEARRLFRTLDQILREIDRDPRGYLFGESTPTYEAGQE